MKELLNALIKYHTEQCSLDSRELKDSINKLILQLFEEMREKILSEEEWLSHIITNKSLYCWTKDKIENLININKRETVILCTSLTKDAYNQNCAVFSKPYKYQYQFFIKDNCYGLLLNSFGSNSLHPNEEECLIELNSIDINNIKRINN